MTDEPPKSALYTAPTQAEADSDAILERLLALHPKRIDLSLDRLTRLLAALGRPERALPPVLHVAGTNGKGSVCAYARAGLEAAGRRTHVYTSPHLARFRERIRLSGALIAEPLLAALLAECETANRGAPITFFEITTAAALLAFARTPADALVLEVGLGGRLDATNVVSDPKVTVITPIGLDHQEFLGETLGAIATEKAGIMKPGVPCVVARQEDEALEAIERAAAAVGAPLLVEGQDWQARMEHGRLAFEDDGGLIDLPAPRLLGAHQASNAGVAVAALRAWGASESACAGAMTDVAWPARLQRLKRGPLVDLATPGAEILLDGGHNPAAAKAVAQALAEMEERAPAPLYLICGMMANKDLEGYLAPFAGLVRRVFAVPIPGEPGAAAPEAVAAAALTTGASAQVVGEPARALRLIDAELRDDLKEETPRILICGSLYLAGRILRENA